MGRRERKIPKGEPEETAGSDIHHRTTTGPFRAHFPLPSIILRSYANAGDRKASGAVSSVITGTRAQAISG